MESPSYYNLDQANSQPMRESLRMITREMGAFISSCREDSDSSDNKKMDKLQKPKELFSTSSLQHPPKWPIECQVIPDKIHHLDWYPNKLENFYVSTNTEPQPQPVGEEMGVVIYNYQPKLSVDYFCHSRVGGCGEVEDVCFKSEDMANTLKFESRFESGNLSKVIKITNEYYELYLRPDFYTDRHSQWFYFRVQNMQENVLYRFSIVNLNKPDSLYKFGLKPLMYSEKDAKLKGTGWVRCGQNITYFKNDLTINENSSFYTLTFTIKFKYSNDSVYFAQCYPYTYSTLQNSLRRLENDKSKKDIVTIRLLCRSLAGNNVYVVTITSPEGDENSKVNKPVVFLSARVHPAETQSSYMMKGIIDFLTSTHSQAKELRDRFVFKLVPMLNPDGVIVGNSRCCLLGQDLNRQYGTVLREAFPQIYHVKVMLRRLVDDNGIFMYCDLHGHSRRNNAFIYGCENKRVPEKRLIEQIFPLMMHKNAADKFSFQNCKFKIQRAKEGTGRVFAWTLGVVNSYTLEITLGGSTLPSRPQSHFHTGDYEAIGRHFCETLLDFSDPSDEKERLRNKILHKLLDGGSTADEPKNMPITDYSSLSHSEADNSDDSSDEDKACAVKKKKIQLVKRDLLAKDIKKHKNERPLITLTTASLDFTHVMTEPLIDFEERSTDTPVFNKQTLNEGRLSEKSAETTVKEEETITTTVRNSVVWTKHIKFRRRTRHCVMEKECNNNTSPKYSRIIFDDPFNPPGAKLRKDEESDEDIGSSDSEAECDGIESPITARRRFPENEKLDLTKQVSQLSISKVPKSADAKPLFPANITKNKRSSFSLKKEKIICKPDSLRRNSINNGSINCTKTEKKLDSQVAPKESCTSTKPSKIDKNETKMDSAIDNIQQPTSGRSFGTAVLSSRQKQRRVSWTGTYNPPKKSATAIKSAENGTNSTKSATKTAENGTNCLKVATKLSSSSSNKNKMKKSKSLGDQEPPTNAECSKTPKSKTTKDGSTRESQESKRRLKL